MARQGLFDCENKSLGLTKWGLIIFNVAFWVSLNMNKTCRLYLQYVIINDKR